ncbi:hypothetical protein V6N12_015170 [Hibiscus sabdariffa]|uniref:RNase H type-1 domain-containing protein n=1 Tax=Hibiscus sabdariffa TaxID=183260 RepID=A0ABR2DMC7_9ROSI
MPFDEISFLLFVGFLCLHFNFRWCFQLFSLLHEGISFSPRKVTLVGHDVNSEADSLVKSGINQLWTAHDILLAAWNLGFCRIQFKTDNLEVVRILQGWSDALAGCSSVDTIRLFLTCSWSVNICHISRMQNMIDDRVVALCRDSLSGSKVFDSVPATLAELVRKETVSF